MSEESLLNSEPASTAPETTEVAPDTTEATGKVAPATESNWRDTLPDELRADPSLQSIQDVANLAKSYIHAQKQVGADKIPVPSKHATEEDWMKVHQRLGLPTELQKYEVSGPSDMDLDEDFFNSFKETAFQSGILPRQAEKLLEWYDGQQKAILSEADQQSDLQRQEQLKELQTRQGTAWELRMTRAQMAADKFGEKVPGFKEWLQESGMDNNPTFVEFLMEVGETFKEDEIVAQKPGSMGMTQRDAQQQIDQIRGNLEHPFHDKKHPGHRSAVEEVTRLYEVAYSG